jgi:acylglycerol lipase
VFKHMADAGVAVYTYDVHGHGRSEPNGPGDRGLITDYTHLVGRAHVLGCLQEQLNSGILAAAGVQRMPTVRCQHAVIGTLVHKGSTCAAAL